MLLIDYYLHDAPPVVPRVERGVLGLRADGGGEKEEVRTQQGHAAGGFGEPLCVGGEDGVGFMSPSIFNSTVFFVVWMGVGKKGEWLDPWTFHGAWLAGLTHAPPNRDNTNNSTSDKTAAPVPYTA